jgi:hypothetical protein
VTTEPSKNQLRIVLPDMCQRHQSLLVRQAGISPSGPWRALIIMAQMALFQGATADPSLHARIDGDLSRLGEVGCLACFKPDRFGEIVEAAKSREPGAIKALGESWVKAVLPPEPPK